MIRLYIFLILFGHTLCIAQHSGTKAYRIEGTIKGIKDGSRVFLINASKRIKIDSALVDLGSFTFSGTLQDAVFAYLYLYKTIKLTDILLTNQVVRVVGNVPVYDSIKVVGSLPNLQWREWYKRDQHIGYQKHRVDILLKAFEQVGDQKHAQMAKVLSEEMMQDRIVLLKEYVHQYRNSPAGALLPNLCTIQSALLRKDYLEMYNMLDTEIRSSALGLELLEFARKAKP
jgi:hypothetical protein